MVQLWTFLGGLKSIVNPASIHSTSLDPGVDAPAFSPSIVYGGAIYSVGESATSFAHRDAVLNIQFYGYAASGETFPDGGIAFIDGLVSSLEPNPYAACESAASADVPPSLEELLDDLLNSQIRTTWIRHSPRTSGTTYTTDPITRS